MLMKTTPVQSCQSQVWPQDYTYKYSSCSDYSRGQRGHESAERTAQCIILEVVLNKTNETRSGCCRLHDVPFGHLLGCVFFKDCTGVLIVNGTDWILHCLLFDTELWLLPQRGREERKERDIKAEGAQKVNKLELVYRAQHCSTWYKGQLSVPVLVSLHMADSIQDWDERLLEPGDGRLVWQGCLPYWWTVACSCKSSCEHSARVRCADVMRLISPYGPRHINSMIMHICLRSCETNVRVRDELESLTLCTNSSILSMAWCACSRRPSSELLSSSSSSSSLSVVSSFSCTTLLAKRHWKQTRLSGFSILWKTVFIISKFHLCFFLFVKSTWSNRESL